MLFTVILRYAIISSGSQEKKKHMSKTQKILILHSGLKSLGFAAVATKQKSHILMLKTTIKKKKKRIQRFQFTPFVTATAGHPASLENFLPELGLLQGISEGQKQLPGNSWYRFTKDELCLTSLMAFGYNMTRFFKRREVQGSSRRTPHRGLHWDLSA